MKHEGRSGKHDGGWVRRSSRYLFESRWFKLRQDEVDLPSGEPITYTLVEHPGFSMVVPLLDDGRVLLERVYRYTVQETLLECPSGGLEGDSFEEAAYRELREETGWGAESMESLGRFFGSDGISNETYEVFLATGLRHEGEPQREATEQMTLEFMPLEEATRLAYAGKISDAPSALAIILANHRLRGSGS